MTDLLNVTECPARFSKERNCHVKKLTSQNNQRKKKALNLRRHQKNSKAIWMPHFIWHQNRHCEPYTLFYNPSTSLGMSNTCDVRLQFKNKKSDPESQSHAMQAQIMTSDSHFTHCQLNVGCKVQLLVRNT